MNESMKARLEPTPTVVYEEYTLKQHASPKITYNNSNKDTAKQD